MKRWPLVALVLLLALFIAPTPSTKAQKTDANQSVKKIKELQKERIAILTKLVAESAELFIFGRARYSQVIEAGRQLLKAELDAAEKESDRIAIWKDAVDLWKEYEKKAETLKQAARVSEVAVLRIKAMRLEAEIELERAKAKEAKERKIKELQQERIATLKELSDVASQLYDLARLTSAELIETRRLLLKAKLDAAEKESERVTIWKKAVDTWKESEKLYEKLQESTRMSKVPVLQIKAMRLEAEIELERAQAREAKESK